MPQTATSTNRLAGEKSPYLLQHQHNPVEWYPWGEEAFEKARREKKPIFLSIGYSTCHWCHVMAHESFENPETARLMNESFVNIKIDREERPDVDRVYMTFVQATTGGGGWPMSVFLTPDLKPFVGGTYFPPQDRNGRAGFPTVLKKITEAWKTDRETILAHGQTVVEQLQRASGGSAPSAPLEGQAAFESCLKQLTTSFDAEFGGFGEAPKFPRPVALNFLFRAYAGKARGAKEESPEGKAALEMALLTLRKMAAGGMHDHLAGGFHRYSVDKFWHIPHFEKMLYDQAQLAVAYLEAYQITHDEQYARTARDILDYVRRDMTAPGGGFYSAEDADSLLRHGHPEHGEGAFAIWTRAEIDEALGQEAAPLFNRFYGVEVEGNAPRGSDPHGEFVGKNTLIERLSVPEAARLFGQSEAAIHQSLGESRAILAKRRAARPRPHLDDKIITAWNGLMISAFARAAQIFQEPAYLQAAQRSAQFIHRELWKNGDPKPGQGPNPEQGPQPGQGLIRSYREGARTVAGFVDDYASLIQGLLDLYEADFDIAWLQWAEALQKKQDELFADREHGGYFSAGTADPHILLRLKEDYDGAEPSPNSVAALNLLRLARITDNSAWEKAALKTIAAFSDQLNQVPTALPQMLCALDASRSKPRQIVLAGPRDARMNALLREVHAHFLPNRVLLLADGGAGQQWLGQRLEFLRTVTPIDGKPAAYVCENFVCKLPVTEAAELRKLLERD